MKIGIAQISSVKGNIELNTLKHVHFIEQAASVQCDVIFFPELSLTGYEPTLAKTLAISSDDARLTIFQQRSDSSKLTICTGAPLKAAKGIQIGMLVFQPASEVQVYAKQLLHEDEMPHFVEGNKQLSIEVRNEILVPAICYESLQPSHAANAYQLGAQFYLASVAKSQQGVVKALKHYPEMAKKNGMAVFMSNSVGNCDNFVSAGQSAV